jgi:hypothetical protein
VPVQIDRRLRIRGPPARADPTNILWENMEIPLFTRVRRELCSTVIVIGLVVLSGILNTLVNSGSIQPGASAVNAIDAAAAKHHVDLPAGISTLPQTVFVVLLNMFIQTTFEFLAAWEGHHHISGREEWLMVKMAVAQVRCAAAEVSCYQFTSCCCCCCYYCCCC